MSATSDWLRRRRPSEPPLSHDVARSKAGLRDSSCPSEAIAHHRRPSPSTPKSTLSVASRAFEAPPPRRTPPSPSPDRHDQDNYVVGHTPPSPAAPVDFSSVASPMSRLFSPPPLSAAANHFGGILSPSFRPGSVSSIASHNLSYLDDDRFGIEYPAESQDADQTDGQSPEDYAADSTQKPSPLFPGGSKVVAGYKDVVAESTWRVLHYLVTGAGEGLDVADLQAIDGHILAIHELIQAKCPLSWPRRPLKHTLGRHPSMKLWSPTSEVITDSDTEHDYKEEEEDERRARQGNALDRTGISRFSKAASELRERLDRQHAGSHPPAQPPRRHDANGQPPNNISQGSTLATATAHGPASTPVSRSPPMSMPPAVPVSKHSTDAADRLVAEAEKLCQELTAMAKSFQERRQELDHIHVAVLQGKEREADRTEGLQRQVEELEEDVRENESELTHLRLQLRAIELQSPKRGAADEDPELTESINNWKADFEAVKSRWRERRSRNNSFRTADDSSMTSTAMTNVTINSSPIRITRGSSMASSFRLSRGSSLSSAVDGKRHGNRYG